MHMTETAAFRKDSDCDKILDPKKQPEGRETFEKLWRSAIIGEDAMGHTVIMESIGRIHPKEFGQLFAGTAAKEKVFLANCTYNKEVFRKWNIKRSSALNKRVYKMIVILDLGGMTTAHVGAGFRELLKTYISKFSNLYPESLYKLFVINAPMIFSGTWGIVKGLVHPITRAKIHIYSNPSYAMTELKKLGVKLGFSFEEVRRLAVASEGGAGGGGARVGRGAPLVPSSRCHVPRRPPRRSTTRPLPCRLSLGSSRTYPSPSSRLAKIAAFRGARRAGQSRAPGVDLDSSP